MRRAFLRFKRRFYVAIFAVALAPSVLDAANGWWKSDGGCALWRVIDGDTLAMRCPEGTVRLRLEAIDTPELNGDCWGETWRAMAAKQRLRWALLTAQSIDLPEVGREDRYGRRLGTALVDGTSAGSILIDAGLAVPYIPGDMSWCERIERQAA